MKSLLKSFQVASVYDIRNRLPATEPIISRVAISSASISVLVGAETDGYMLNYFPAMKHYQCIDLSAKQMNRGGAPLSEEITLFHNVLKEAATIHSEVHEYLLEHLPQVYSTQLMD